LFVAKPGAQQMLDLLATADAQLGVITNVPAGFTRPQLEALLADPGFLNQFDVLVLSSQAPAAKPSPLIYQHAHGLLPLPVAITDTAFVGETLTEIGNSAVAPTSGARATGMIGIHLSTAAASPLADHTIRPDHLPDVAALVASLCSVSADGFED
jgi:FMN phosphatase YigB (HAD superfamily)